MSYMELEKRKMIYKPKIKRCERCGALYNINLKECPMCKYIGLPMMHQKKVTNEAYIELKNKYNL